MPERQGFLSTLVRIHTKREMSKPLFGKPSIKYGQTFIISGYIFQVGGILGAAFHDKLTPFLTVYNGTTLLDKAIADMEGHWMEEIMGVWDDVNSLNEFVMAFEDKRFGLPPDSLGSIAAYGTKKLDNDTAFFLPWNFGMMGAALGLMKPDTYRQWFENGYKVDPEKWARAHKAGLAIPAEPDVVTYEQSEQDALDMFLPFASEFLPEFNEVLVRT